MNGLALVIPEPGEIVQPGIVEAFELDVRNRVRDIDDIDALIGPVDQMNALAKALAGTRLAPYARAAARRIEWRVGRLLGPPPGKGRRIIDSDQLSVPRADERSLFRLIGTLELEWDLLEPWAQDRAQLVRTARERLREPDDSELDIRHGDFATALADIEPRSVALILTDPPYAQKALPDYGRLGEFAAEKLVDGGSLVCYVGQTTLPGALEQIGRHLRYWWCLALNQQGRGQRLPGKWVRPKWKPVLWFVNGGRRDHVYVDDMLRGTIPAKQLHGWAQGVDEVLPLIQGLTEPGELVVDPFAGSGSFGIAAQHKLGRRFIGADDRSGGV
jgi:DNA methylase